VQPTKENEQSHADHPRLDITAPLRLDFPSSQYDIGYKQHLKLQPDDGLLRAICDAWGPSLRLLHLACTRLSVDDMHQVLAICPRLRWLGAGYVVLKDANGELFGDGMEPHASLRAIVLPMAACAHLVAYVDRLCTHCPALKETDADVVLDQADLVASCARRAAAAGVRRFICNSFSREVVTAMEATGAAMEAASVSIAVPAMSSSTSRVAATEAAAATTMNKPSLTRTSTEPQPRTACAA
jgi:hypothetical protein